MEPRGGKIKAPKRERSSGQVTAGEAKRQLPSAPKTSEKDKPNIHKPQVHFQQAEEVVRHEGLSHAEKKEALDVWEQDARQLLTASNEGMPGREEGLSAADAPKLGEVIRAKGTLGEKPKTKTSH